MSVASPKNSLSLSISSYNHIYYHVFTNNSCVLNHDHVVSSLNIQAFSLSSPTLKLDSAYCPTIIKLRCVTRFSFSMTYAL